MSRSLTVMHRLESDKDAHGNPSVTWSAPQSWEVRGLAPGASVEPNQPNRDASLVEWTVYADANNQVPNVRDRVVIDGRDYEVTASPADWTRGPWEHPTAGVVVELKHWEG